MLFALKAGEFKIIRDLAESSLSKATAPPRKGEDGALDVFDVRPQPKDKALRPDVSGSEVFDLNVLEGIANHVARLPGRKPLIWLCQNYALDTEPPLTSPMRQYWLSAMAALQRSYVAVYTISCPGSGFPTANQTRITASGLPDPAVVQTTSGLNVKREKKRSGGVMKVISSSTGGRYYAGTMELARAFRQALEDNMSVFQLEWRPEGESSNSVHTLLLRGADSMLYPRQYVTPEYSSDIPHRLSALETALVVPLPSRSLDLDVSQSVDAGILTFEILLDPSNIQFVEDRRSSGKSALLDVVFAFANKDGKRLEQGLRNEISFRIKDSEWHKFVHKLKDWKQSIHIPEGATSVRVVVRDAHTGAYYSQSFLLGS